MKLNLKQVLDLVNIAKPRFDSARRRGLYSFMYQALEGEGPEAEYENTRRRFGIEHVVGLACINFATERLGVDLEMADSIVGNTFGHLAQAIAAAEQRGDLGAKCDGDDHFFIGVVFSVVGRYHLAGPLGSFQESILREVLEGDHPDSHYDKWLLGSQMIDATTVYRLVKRQMLAGQTLA